VLVTEFDLDQAHASECGDRRDRVWRSPSCHDQAQACAHPGRWNTGYETAASALSTASARILQLATLHGAVSGDDSVIQCAAPCQRSPLPLAPGQVGARSCSSHRALGRDLFRTSRGPVLPRLFAATRLARSGRSTSDQRHCSSSKLD